MITINKKIKDILNRDSKVMLRTTREKYPFIPASGGGSHVYDVAGNKFLDFSSFISVYNLGVNANIHVRNAVKKQVDILMHPAFTDFYSELPVEYAEKLVKMFPQGFGRVFFSNSGTEANEDAIKLAKLFTDRKYLISFYNAFHGRTMGALALTSSKTVQHAKYGPFSGVVHTQYPDCYRSPLEEDCWGACIDNIKDNILGRELPPDEVAAVFIEPIQGEGGYIVPPIEFMKQLRKLTKQHGILLVDDEIQAGFMRTGEFLAMDNFGIEADIYTMAKSVGGGLPIGVTVSRKSLGDVPAGAHANTFGGNLLAIAAANASLDYVKKNMHELKKGVKDKGKYVMKRLNEMKEKYEIIGDVRGIGLMIGVEFVKDRKTKEYAAKERDEIIENCFYNGLVLLPAGISTIRIIPQLEISMHDLDHGLNILENAIKQQKIYK